MFSEGSGKKAVKDDLDLKKNQNNEIPANFPNFDLRNLQNELEASKLTEKELKNEISLLKSQNSLLNEENKLKNEEIAFKNKVIIDNDSAFKRIQVFFNDNEKSLSKIDKVTKNLFFSFKKILVPRNKKTA